MILEHLTPLLESRSPRILIDTSIVNITEGIPAINEVMEAVSFNDMSVDTLEALIKNSTHYTEVLKSDKILTIPEVLEEFSRYVTSFGSRYSRILAIMDHHSKSSRNKTQKKTPKRERINYLDYTEDGEIFQYIFDDLEDVSTYINVDAESGDVVYYNILLNSYTEKELKATQKRMEENYDIDECHNQFFMMSQDEIEEIMGDDNYSNYLESGDYWLEYDDESSGRSVHFYFPTNNDLGCIMIRVIYSW